MEENKEKIIPPSSLNEGFLQSEEWRKFQESTGRKTFHVEHDGFWANVIEHKLPVVGNYFYIPRGLIISDQESANSEQLIDELVNLAKEEKAGWIRFDPENEKSLNLIKKNINYKIQKSPHDMQPKEIFVIDISKNEEELLAEMKSKTRYNIKLAEKKGVRVISHCSLAIGEKYIEEFIKLVNLTAKRKGIKFHPENYYRKMIEMIPGEILKLYIAEYDNKIIAANLVVFYDKTAVYFHGATDDEYRNMMAPYFLQWQAILDAKKAGCEKYDFGGIKTWNKKGNGWEGITKFKLGFSQTATPIKFPGSYDVVISPLKYWIYSILQKIKAAIS